MTKPTVTLSSPENTPEEEKIYVLEYPSTSRIKVRYVDLEKEIENIDKDIVLKEARKEELNEIKSEIDKIK